MHLHSTHTQVGKQPRPVSRCTRVHSLPSNSSSNEQQSSTGKHQFRFWIDEKRFKGTGEDSIAQQTLLRLGGRRMGGNIKSAPTPGPMGWQVLDKWDLLWSPSTPASQAAEKGLRPGQITSAVPGSRCLTRKRMLTRTLHKAYGQDAFTQITPLTYELPVQLKAWLAQLTQKEPAPAPAPAPADAGSSGSGGGAAQQGRSSVKASSARPMWILKTAQNLGKGMVICRQREALKAVLVRTQAVKSAVTPQEKKQVRPFVVAQRYVSDPLLINGRKFGIRVWVTLTSSNPLRLYLHQYGLVLFSSQEYKPHDPGDLQSHLTNYAQNVDGEVWSMEQLRSHMGHTYEAVHASIQKIIAMTFAAGAPHMRKACQEARVPHGCAFELFGLDFVIDSQLQPWLLEINATPSLAVEHADDTVRQLIYDQKDGMMDDLMSLLRVPDRFQEGAGATALAEVQAMVQAHCPEACLDEEVALHLVSTELELRCARRWLPLMHLVPQDDEAEENEWTVDRTDLDTIVQRWCATREQVVASSARAA